jgi:hypothetical protein
LGVVVGQWHDRAALAGASSCALCWQEFFSLAACLALGLDTYTFAANDGKNTYVYFV